MIMERTEWKNVFKWMGIGDFGRGKVEGNIYVSSVFSWAGF